MDQRKGNLKNLIPLIILNWNGESDTLDCLQSIKKSTNNRFLPVIIDNGSKVDSLKFLKEGCTKLYKNIFYSTKEQIDNSSQAIIDLLFTSSFEETLIFIENNENLGFARGNNIGIKIAKLLDTDWVMLLNNDTEIEGDALKSLDIFITTNNDYMVVTPQIRLFSNKQKIWNCGGKLTLFGSRRYYYADESIEKVPGSGSSTVTFVTGCALLFQYKKTGILTEDFFFGEEDYEFSLRMKKNSYKIACLYNSIIYHKVGSTINKNSNLTNSIYLYYINRLINTRNYYSHSRWQITRILSYLYLPFLLKKNNLNPLNAFLLLNSINNYIQKNHQVSSTEFNRIINQ